MNPKMDPRITHVIRGICVVIEQLPTPTAKQLRIVIQHLLHLEEQANFPPYSVRLFLSLCTPFLIFHSQVSSASPFCPRWMSEWEGQVMHHEHRTDQFPINPNMFSNKWDQWWYSLCLTGSLSTGGGGSLLTVLVFLTYYAERQSSGRRFCQGADQTIKAVIDHLELELGGKNA
jgi:hypothetical protein